MSFTIKRPLSPSERILTDRMKKAEAIAAAYFAENLILRARIRNMIEGTGWRMKWARKLICMDEARRVPLAATSPEKSDSGAGPALTP